MRLRSLRASVQIATRHTPIVSKAWDSSRYLASVLIAVRWAVDASHVPPISSSSGSAPAAPPLDVEVARATGELARVEPALGEREHAGRGVVGEQLLDVRASSPLRRPGPRCSRSVCRSTLAAATSPSTCSSDERFELHVAAGEGDRFERLGHPATVANQRACHNRADARSPITSRPTRSGCARSTSSGCDASGAPSGAWLRPGYAAWIADMDFDVAPGIRAGVARGDRRRRVRLSRLGRHRRLVAGRPAVPAADGAALRLGSDRSTGSHDLANVIQGVRATVHHLSRPGDGVVLHMPAYYPFLDTHLVDAAHVDPGRMGR